MSARRERRKLGEVVFQILLWPMVCLVWYFLYMAAANEALTTGSTTLYATLLALAMGVAGVCATLLVSDKTRDESFRAPLVVSILAAFLMLANLGLPEYSTIPYATATMITRYTFYAKLMMGGLGIFALVSSFPLLIKVLILQPKRSERATNARLKEDRLPYQSLNSRTRLCATVFYTRLIKN